MKSKFDEFYFENDKNYPADVYWSLYDHDRQAAINKYEGHMFCPLCRLAPLTVAKGNQRRYFKVVESDMDKHDSDCSYRCNKGSKRDTEIFYRNLDETDIRNRLVSCMNRMLKKSSGKTNSKGSVSSGQKKHEKSFLNFNTDSGETKYLPHKNFNSKSFGDDIGIQKIYYGRCALYIVKYIPQEENDIKMYYLKVLNQETKKQICDVSIPVYVYKYLENDLKEIPEEKQNAINYYLCFSGVLETGKYTYKCRLTDSRLLVLEKNT